MSVLLGRIVNYGKVFRADRKACLTGIAGDAPTSGREVLRHVVFDEGMG